MAERDCPVFPTLSEPELKTLYPPDLALKSIRIIHRHGPRTPLNYRAPHLFPFQWSMCHLANRVATIAPSTDNLDSLRLLTRTPNNHPVFKNNLEVPMDLIGNEPVNQVNSSALSSGLCYFGQLTDKGRIYMNSLGSALRKLYVDRLGFLESSFSPTNVYVRSTNYPRTIESVQSVLHGMYPSLSQEVPVQINLRDEYAENLFGSSKCKRYRHLLKEFAEQVSMESKAAIEEIKAALPHMFDSPDIFGNMPSVYGMYDTLASRKAHGLPIPKEVTPEIFDKMEMHSVAEWFAPFKQSQEATKLCIGRFLGELANLICIDAKEPSPKHRVSLFSAHDSTIAPILVALGKYDNKWPPFGANITVELFEEQKSSRNYVRVKYNGKPLILPSCLLAHRAGDPSLCTLDKFAEICRRVVPNDYLGECRQ